MLLQFASIFIDSIWLYSISCNQPDFILGQFYFIPINSRSIPVNPIQFRSILGQFQSILFKCNQFWVNSSQFQSILGQLQSIPIPTPVNSSQFQFQFQSTPVNSNSNSSQLQSIPIPTPVNSSQFQLFSWNWNWLDLELVHPYMFRRTWKQPSRYLELFYVYGRNFNIIPILQKDSETQL